MVAIPRPSDRQDTREHADVLHGLANVLTGQVAASPVIDGSMTLNGPLVWTTDNSFDIGASGATRPRDLFLGRNATVGGSLTVTGGQIAFPAVQNPSAGANTLDDYEEGSWTPSVGGTATYSAQTGGYIKIGRVVVVWMDLTINVLGTGSTNTISGLPFAADTGGSGVVDLFTSLAINVTELNVVANGSSQLVLIGTTAAAATAGVAAALGNGSRIRCQCTYRTAN